MTFVVVYIISAREYIILPDNCVQDLNTAKLKNNGCNSNQNFLAYVSNIRGNVVDTPNFDAPLLNTMEDLRDEACFLCRIKKFFGNLSIHTLFTSCYCPTNF